jgi:hypothetical protein
MSRSVKVWNFCCTLLAKSNNLSHQLGANLIPDVAPTCVKTLQIQNQLSRALLFVTTDLNFFQPIQRSNSK